MIEVKNQKNSESFSTYSVYFKGKSMKNILCFLLLLLSPVSLIAGSMPISTSACHCFQNRVYDPQKKFIADEYLLATSFNSFLATKFQISKTQIILLKMKGGVAPDDLLLGLYVAEAWDVELSIVLAILENGGSWQQILSSESFLEKQLDNELFQSIEAALDTQGLAAERVTAQLLKEFFHIQKEDIAQLRKEGASGRELVLLYILERYAKAAPKVATLWARYHTEGRSWAEIVDGLGLTPKDTGTLVNTQN